jgi:murein L,D-transpeptidase YafK
MNMNALISILVLTLIGAGIYLMTPHARQQIDRFHINIQRVENKALHSAGKPMPGTPDLARLNERLASLGVQSGAPIFIRIFKLESELELWVEKNGRYELFATYPICLWSGRLGPKLREGDRQAPEGFYTVSSEQLNPNSRWHRSFNLGFPNAFDQAHGRTGTFLMVHGGCLSIGCYAMTDAVVDEIWGLVTAALDENQERFAVHVFPFRMTERNLDLRKGYQWASFWADLKKGYDLFEERRVPPLVSVCNGSYAFESGTVTGTAPLVEARCPAEIAGNS